MGLGAGGNFVWYRVELFIIQVVLTVECKFCEISNQMFFNVMFSFLKTKEKLVMT